MSEVDRCNISPATERRENRGAAGGELIVTPPAVVVVVVLRVEAWGVGISILNPLQEFERGGRRASIEAVDGVGRGVLKGGEEFSRVGDRWNKGRQFV